MKQLLSLLLSFALALSFVPIAFAATDEAVNAANSLYELGLFNGTGTDANGNPIFDLDRAPTRHEAITMLVRLLGKTTEAESGTWATPFIDVAEWAKPYVGYAYTNGLAGGTSATTFSGNDTVSASQYLTFVLRALGYESGTDFQWDKAWELSDKIGLTDGRYNTGTANFTRGDVAIISYKAHSMPSKGQAGTVSSNQTYINSDFLLGDWFGQNDSDRGLHMEWYQFTSSGYSCAFRVFDITTDELAASCYEEGTYSIHNNTLELHSTKRYTLNAGSNQTQISNESSSNSYNLSFDDDLLYMNAWSYMRMDEDRIALFPLYDTIKSEVMEHTSPVTSSSSDYGYLVASDFRTIRQKYIETPTALCGYALAFTDLNGDSCVLTTIQYKIISNYSATFLHNLTQGKTIEEPAKYYNQLASRAYGGSKMHYWDLANEVLEYTKEMLEATANMLESGNNTGSGVFIDAATLNQ